MAESAVEVTTLNYNTLMKLLHCVTIEVCNLPMYNGLTTTEEFLSEFEKEVPKQ